MILIRKSPEVPFGTDSAKYLAFPPGSLRPYVPSFCSLLDFSKQLAILFSQPGGSLGSARKKASGQPGLSGAGRYSI
jgi:hypothetical protein